jgi:hypothetical protein
VLSDFPVDGSNRILTPTADRTAPINPDETLPPADPPAGITLDNIGQYIDLPPPRPDPADIPARRCPSTIVVCRLSPASDFVR